MGCARRTRRGRARAARAARARDARAGGAADSRAGGAGGPSVLRLVRGQEAEALAFLAARPIHTVIMSSMIRDNGLESPLNRGDFHACRDASDALTGVALLGHLTLVEARDPEVNAAFARRARDLRCARLIVGESEKIEQFWSHFASGAQVPHVSKREHLLELCRRPEACAAVPSLRRATPEDTARVAEVHARMAQEASGVNPLKADPEGFTGRVRRRIEQGRVWVWVEGGRLVFKADVVSETPEVCYLEGLYVDPRERGRGYGLRCLTQLCRLLLEGARSVCLLVDEGNEAALSLYRRAGFELRSHYDTIFLHPPDAA
jgi:uncharacterized protein